MHVLMIRRVARRALAAASALLLTHSMAHAEQHPLLLPSTVNPAMGTWTTTLQPRDLTGDGVADAYFDTQQNITWLANASSYNGTLLVANSGWDAGMLHSTADAWASALTVGSADGWRLPRAAVSTTAGAPVFTPAGSELAHLFMQTLGNVQTPGASRNSGPFSNLMTQYWLQGSLDLEPGKTVRPYFWSIDALYTGWVFDGESKGAWAVHDGDVGVSTAVPEPSRWLLAVAGLGVLAVLQRRAGPIR